MIGRSDDHTTRAILAMAKALCLADQPQPAPDCPETFRKMPHCWGGPELCSCFERRMRQASQAIAILAAHGMVPERTAAYIIEQAEMSLSQV